MHVYIELASVSTETDRLRNIGKMYHMRRGQRAASLTSVRCQTQETPAIQPEDFHLLSTKNIHDKIIIIIVTNQLDIVCCTCTFSKKLTCRYGYRIHNKLLTLSCFNVGLKQGKKLSPLSAREDNCYHVV